MAGQILSTNFQKDLLPGVQKFFGLAYPNWESKYDKFMNVDKVSERYQEDVLGAGLGIAAVKPEGAPVKYDTMSQGWTKRYEQVVYATGFVISREARDDGHALKLAQIGATQAKRALSVTREIVCANILNNAFTAGNTGGDGSILCVTTHPTKMAGNLQNTLTTASDFCEAALEQAAIDIMNQVDDRNIKMFINPKKLVLPVALRFEAHRVLNSVRQVYTADNTPNALKDLDVLTGSEPVINPYITGSSTYFIITDAEKGLRYLERDAMEMTEDGDFDTENAKYKGRIRFVTGWSDWRGVYGVNGP